jgi:hypothetical protein
MEMIRIIENAVPLVYYVIETIKLVFVKVPHMSNRLAPHWALS